jgi:cytidylate kinase
MTKRKDLVITMSGVHGVGKSVYAKAIAEKYGLKYVSSGMIFRGIARRRNISLEDLSREAEVSPELDKSIDNAMIEEGKRGGVVLDGLLVGWMLKDIADIKFWFKADDMVRFSRIADRDGVDINKAMKETVSREKSEKDRFMKYYGIDLDDLSIYNYVIDTTWLTIDDILMILYRIIDRYIERG